MFSDTIQGNQNTGIPIRYIVAIPRISPALYDHSAKNLLVK